MGGLDRFLVGTGEVRVDERADVGSGTGVINVNLVASPGGSYAMRTGTSFAAPQVSGIAALLLERNRNLDPVAIRSILTSTARDLGPPGKDDQFGAGLVNAMSAVESAGMQSTEVSARTARPGN